MNILTDVFKNDELSTLTAVSHYFIACTELFNTEYELTQNPMEQDGREYLEGLREEIKTDLGIESGVDVVQSMEDVLKIFQNVEERETNFLSEIESAENSITSKYYKTLNSPKDGELDVSINADTVHQVMCYSPGFMARRINRLDSEFKKKLLEEKCREFLALKRKAHDLISNEKKIRTSNINDIMLRLLEMRFLLYEHDMLTYLPPSGLHDFIRKIEEREIRKVSDFTPAINEPQYITVGSIHYGYAIDNQEALDFLKKDYGFILDEAEKLCLPYTIAMNEHLALCYKYDGSSSEVAQQDMQNLCMSIFLATPPNKIRFCFIDPLRMGHSFAVFNNFEDNNASNVNVIVGGRTLTEKEDIERQLRILVGTINTMVSMTFRGEYQNIREYNDANPLAPQPYHIVGIMDFPAGFTQESLDLLEKIVTEGRRCGIYVIIKANQAQFVSMGQSLREKINGVLRKCTCFTSKKGGHGYVADDDNGANEVDRAEDDADTVYRITTPIETSEILKIAPIMK